VNCAGQPIPVEEQNAPGFYYIVRWRRLPNNSSLAASGWGAADTQTNTEPTDCSV